MAVAFQPPRRCNLRQQPLLEARLPASSETTAALAARRAGAVSSGTRSGSGTVGIDVAARRATQSRRRSFKIIELGKLPVDLACDLVGQYNHDDGRRHRRWLL